MPSFSHRLARAAMRCYPFPRGQGRIVDRTFLSRLNFGDEKLLVNCEDGFQMWVAPNDHIGRHLYLTGQFDRTIVDVAGHFCRDGDCILDIGANVGYVSCSLLKRFLNCRVVSVEPVPSTFAILSQNLDLVGKGRGKAINAAVSGNSGIGTMAISSVNSGANRLLQGNAGENMSQPTVKVPLITGEELFRLSGFQKIDFVKIDVEGHETTVLQSLATTLERQRPKAVVFEHEGDLNDRVSPVRQILDSIRFKAFVLKKSLMRWQLLPVDGDDASTIHAHDYVAVPVESTFI